MPTKARKLLVFTLAKGFYHDSNRDDHDDAISWIKKHGQGRVFYCSFGHQHEIFWTKPILQHYLDGIQYALGDLKADATPRCQEVIRHFGITGADSTRPSSLARDWRLSCRRSRFLTGRVLRRCKPQKASSMGTVFFAFSLQPMGDENVETAAL